MLKITGTLSFSGADYRAGHHVAPLPKMVTDSDAAIGIAESFRNHLSGRELQR